MTPDHFEQALKALHWTDDVFAEKTGIHPRTVRRYRMGQMRVPPLLGEWLELVVHLIERAPTAPQLEGKHQ